jgi:uncharacterized protein YneF (UPF0154 family)
MNIKNITIIFVTSILGFICGFFTTTEYIKPILLENQQIVSEQPAAALLSDKENVQVIMPEQKPPTPTQTNNPST